MNPGKAIGKGSQTKGKHLSGFPGVKPGSKGTLGKATGGQNALERSGEQTVKAPCKPGQPQQSVSPPTQRSAAPLQRKLHLLLLRHTRDTKALLIRAEKMIKGTKELTTSQIRSLGWSLKQLRQDLRSYGAEIAIDICPGCQGKADGPKFDMGKMLTDIWEKKQTGKGKPYRGSDPRLSDEGDGEHDPMLPPDYRR